MLTTDTQETSRGLSATAELLVVSKSRSFYGLPMKYIGPLSPPWCRVCSLLCWYRVLTKIVSRQFLCLKTYRLRADGSRVDGGIWPCYKNGCGGGAPPPPFLTAAAAARRCRRRRRRRCQSTKTANPLKSTGLYAVMLRSTNLGPLNFCEKLIGRQYFATGSPISMKFGRLTCRITFRL